MIQRIFASLFAAVAVTAATAGVPSKLRVLFLGDQGHHRPADRFKQLQPVLAARGIEMVYSERMDDLSPGVLAGYDGVAIYANTTRISPAQEDALLQFVAAGGGCIPIHCASYCFLNSSNYVALVGAQFKSHGTGVFRETYLQPSHPVLQGLQPIESWDETYVHQLHNTNRVVLAERVEGDHHEPWTWVRQHGRGRVFYTAWGHDERTWSNPGFHALIESGLRWATAESPARLQPRPGVPRPAWMDMTSPLPNYRASGQGGGEGEQIKRMQQPLEPAESQRHWATLPGFEMRLFASEPQLVKPIYLAWDPRGRLWVAETVDYPNEMQPPGQGRDRLTICEDTDGDGRADQFTVFADRLSVPTAFTFAHGGVVVVHSGETTFLQDTNGDDRADVRRTLFQGWGTGDTHAGPSNLRWGFDNWIWGVVGYSGFDGEVGGQRVRFSMGFFRFKPDGSKLEFIRSSNNNTWGFGFSEDALVFGSTANGNASMFMPIPNRYYEAVRGWSAARLETIADSQQIYPITESIRQVDWHGKYTAAAGHALYTARHFPKEYWNRTAFVAEPTGHLLGRFNLEAVGTDFIAHNARSFLASDDEWSSPILAEVGPDGALWVIDWYNYVIQHNPTPQGFRTGRGNAYETPLRDKTHGRIYRLIHTGSPLSPPLNLAQASPRDLVQALRHDNLHERMQAQRLLVEGRQSSEEVVQALVALVRDRQVDELGLNPGALHAIWTLAGLGQLASADRPAHQAVLAATDHPSAAVRRAALMALREGVTADVFARHLDDADPQVRLAALLGLADAPRQESAGRAIFEVLQRPANTQDRWLVDGALAAAAKHDAGFLLAVLGARLDAPTPAPTAPRNLLPNSSAESLKNGEPEGWNRVTYSGKAEFSVASEGHTGAHSFQMSSKEGADASWSATVAVKPRTQYRLTGWLKTQDLQPARGGRGALFNIHEVQGDPPAVTRVLTGTTGWTPLDISFNSGELNAITVNCLLGGWGHGIGTAWFDDLELMEIGGPALPGELGRVVQVVTAHYAQRGPVDSIIATLMALKTAPAGVAAPLLDGLVVGWPPGTAPALDPAQIEGLQKLMAALPEQVRDRLLALSRKWGRPELFAEQASLITAGLRQAIAAASLADEERVAAARRLVGLLDNAETGRFLVEQITPLTTPILATGLINAVGEGRHAELASSLLGRWSQFTPAFKRTAVAVLLRRPEWTKALLDTVEAGTLSRTEVSAESWSQLRQNPDKSIAERANKLGSAVGAISADRQAIVEKFLPLARQKGDVVRGKEVFTASCANCHTFNGQGGKIGPDLTGIGARPRTDILTEILDPNRSVEANYRLWNVTTKDNEVFSGRLETETQTTVEILDVNAVKHVIQRQDIHSLDASQLSIMPVGFESLPADDLKGLLEFLAQPH